MKRIEGAYVRRKDRTMTTGQKVVVAAGFVVYSYLLSNTSYYLGRVRGWADTVTAMIDATIESSKKKESKTDSSEN